MYKDLSHLNEKDLNILIEKYYSENITVQEILEEYKLDIQASKLYTYFPPIVFKKYECIYCKSYMVANRHSKTYGDKYYTSDLYCPNCNHRYDDKFCNCEHCKQVLLDKEISKQEMIFETYNTFSIDSIIFEKLSFINKIYLGAIVRALISEDLDYIKELELSNVKLSPYNNFDFEIYRQLTKEKILLVSPFSNINAFEDSDKFPNVYYIDKVQYLINISKIDDSLEKTIETIINPEYFTLDNVDEAYNLWIEIAINECIEYLMYRIDKVKFKFNPAKKTYSLFKLLLNNFSVSQIYNIIYRSVASASQDYLERGISKEHAANCIIGACERYANKALMKGWNIESYGRNYDLRQSEISEFFFNKVIKIGDLGFNIAPNIEFLRNKFNNL
ncbi:hypothetical protein [Brachyspira pilosicoli]|uniref:hypothetical protein n=1 Tax=Brachyspira pilosicoli TaxID=52584 RepID=UPI000C75F9D8|nr:hypothetical protein [Brachyspira pilosicoli]PLV58576.1 hypothetical protein BPSP16_08535 [Brachyspira pilosicoli SP16]